jgi:hypothetical protein
MSRFCEGIHPDPDLPDLAREVKALCIKGQGQIDDELMFRTLFAAGFDGPLAIERLDGRTEKIPRRFRTGSRGNAVRNRVRLQPGPASGLGGIRAAAPGTR